jgi:hypothetical protein
VESQTDHVRAVARKEFIEPARQRGEISVRVVAGDVQKRAGLVNRMPLVVQALKGKKFLQENGLTIEKCEGPPSGLSTTVTLTYRLADKPAAQKNEGILRLLELRGIGKDWYKDEGGLSEKLRKDYEEWDRTDREKWGLPDKDHS